MVKNFLTVTYLRFLLHKSNVLQILHKRLVLSSEFYFSFVDCPFSKVKFEVVILTFCHGNQFVSLELPIIQ